MQALLEQVNIKLTPSGNNLLTFRKISYLNVITTVSPAHKLLNKGSAMVSKRARANVKCRLCEFWLVYIWCFGSTRDQRSVIYLKVVPRLSETKAADPNLRVNSVNSSHWLSPWNAVFKETFFLYSQTLTAPRNK